QLVYQHGQGIIKNPFFDTKLLIPQPFSNIRVLNRTKTRTAFSSRIELSMTGIIELLFKQIP
ncbi:MAG TPA: hypothetical protein PLO24_11830, partial [Bacteroidales bacterium]|nr:hypothetical protein [Bacteroidales bacterium]